MVALAPTPAAAHHKHSPSRLGRIRLCPGSARLSEGIIDVPSPEAEEGTRLHALVAAALSGPRPPMNGDQADLVDRCLAFAGDKLSGEIVTELHLELRALGDPARILTAGTLDAASRDNETAHLIDWKFGRLELSADNATVQLAAYTAMLFQEWPVKRVEAWIYQPRLERTYHTAFSLLDDLPAIVGMIRLTIRSAEAPGLKLEPSSDACAYCPAIGLCPAVRLQAQALERVEAKGLAGIPGPQVSYLLDLGERAATQYEALREETKRRLKAGELVPGWKLQPRTTQALVRDASTALERTQS